MTSFPEYRPLSWRNKRYSSFDTDCCAATPCFISSIAWYLWIFRCACLSKLDSTSASVTADKLNSAAKISCVLISSARCNLCHTLCFPSVPCFLTFHSPSPWTLITVASIARCWIGPLVFVLKLTSTSLARWLIQQSCGQHSESWASWKTEPISPCEALSGIENNRFTIKTVFMAKPLKTQGLPRFFACFASTHLSLLDQSKTSKSRDWWELDYIASSCLFCNVA